LDAFFIAAMANPIVLVPARMSSTRLPGKPLADIWGEPMIVHVWRRAMEADVGPVLIAADDARIVEAVTAAGGRAALTRPDHGSGSDRIFEALTAVDPDGRHDVIVNVQGDLPTIAREAVRAAVGPLADRDVDIATLATEIRRAEERDDPNVVKAVGSEVAPGRLRALYFTRARAPWGEGPLLHHIGLYAYRRAALQRFVALPPSPLERRERLEQLRALEAGMRIDIALVDVAPLGVDTPEDLRRAREMLAPKGRT
jgi:3-deoxy-manno-octulosonate cytidylyltransferase (CMP-KDO synthetase)